MDRNDLQNGTGGPDRAEWERLGRYLEGRSTPEETRAVLQWIAEDPRREELVQQMRRALQATAAAPGLWDVEGAWRRLVARVESEEVDALESEAPRKVIPFCPMQTTPAPLHRRRSSGFAVALRIAATVIALVGGTMLWQNRETLIGPAEIALQEFAAGQGERMRVTLADGTGIVLGPESRIWFPERFGNSREVRLEGEAVFDVATDSTRAFRVLTDASVTQVLGTRFGVRAYPADEYVEVVVAEGRVAVAAAGSPAEMAGQQAPRAKQSARATEALGTQLTPGLAVRVESDGTLSAPRAVDADRVLAWTEGRLLFDDTPLHEVSRTLKRRYGIDVELADPAVAALRLTAEFRQPAVVDVVKLISLSLDIEYQKTPNGYRLFHSTATKNTPRDGDQNR